jgi:hypothetical protein
VDRWYRLAFNALAAITILPIFPMLATLPDRTLYVVPAPWRWLMVGGQGLALAGMVGSFHEERRLLAEFGDAYRDYQQQVPRLIPRPGRCYSPPPAEWLVYFRPAVLAPGRGARSRSLHVPQSATQAQIKGEGHETSDGPRATPPTAG